MADRTIEILLLATLSALASAQAREAIGMSTFDRVERLLKAADLGESRDEAMSAIEKLADSLKNGSYWRINSPKHVLEMLLEVYKANKANEAREDMDCDGGAAMAARTLYEAVLEMVATSRCKTFAGYTNIELREYATICAKARLAESKLSISSLNGTIMDRVRTLTQYVREKDDSQYAQAIYNYMVEQTGKEGDPDARYLRLIVDPKKQDAVPNIKKLSELRKMYVSSTCTAYLEAAAQALSKADWARDVLVYSELWSAEKSSAIYDEILDYIGIYEVCRQALKEPLLSVAEIAKVIDH